MPPVVPDCATCKWFVRINVDEGECHRHPPVTVPPHPQYHYHGFPIVITNDPHPPWCAEYEKIVP